MKAVKVILNTFFILLFIVSICFNLLSFNSSYGILIFKNDEDLLKSMIYSDIYTRFDINAIHFSNDNLKKLKHKNGTGYMIKYSLEEWEGITMDYQYHIYFDEKEGFTYSYYTEEPNGQEVYGYYVNQIYYTEAEGYKVRDELTDVEAQQHESKVLYEFHSIYTNYLVSYSDIENLEFERSVSFCFSPFYVLGLKISFEKDDKTVELFYDLSGNLRKAVITNEDKGSLTVKISTKNSPFERPDFQKFALQKQ